MFVVSTRESDVSEIQLFHCSFKGAVFDSNGSSPMHFLSDLVTTLDTCIQCYSACTHSMLMHRTGDKQGMGRKGPWVNMAHAKNAN